jgi:hypothetical protein
MKSSHFPRGFCDRKPQAMMEFIEVLLGDPRVFDRNRPPYSKNAKTVEVQSSSGRKRTRAFGVEFLNST